MSNPLKSFRKHRKVWFAVLTLMCMLAFVFLPSVTMLDRSRQARDAVVVRSKYGQLRESDLAQLRHHRQVALQFLQGVSESLAGPVAKRGQSPDQNRGREALEVKEQIGPIDERDMVRSWLLAQRAKQLGLSMDDPAINAFIQRISEKRLTTSAVRGIIVGTMHSSVPEVFNALRDELLALEFKRIFGVSLEGMTPSQLWDSFLRLNRIAKIEAVPVKVEPFVKDVPDSSQAEVRDFFDEHKDRDEDPTSIQVGFNQPHKVNIQYFKIEPEASLNLDAVTEEQIKAEYEATKDTYYKEEKPAETPKPAETGKPVESGKPTGQPAAGSGKTAAPSKPTTPKPAESTKPAGKSAAAAGPKAETPKPEAAAKPAKAAKLPPPASAKPEKKPAPAAPEKNPETIPPRRRARNPRRHRPSAHGSLFRFVAMEGKDASRRKRRRPLPARNRIRSRPSRKLPRPKRNRRRPSRNPASPR